MDIVKIRKLLSLLSDEISRSCFTHLTWDERRDTHDEVCCGCDARVTYKDWMITTKHAEDCPTQEIERLVTELQNLLPDEDEYDNVVPAQEVK